ncbi:hypothetical protein AOLI_G00041500 [Acnodon oligacanthus]
MNHRAATGASALPCLRRRFDSALRRSAESEQRETENIDKERVLIGFLERAESGGRGRRSRREITCFCYRGSELCCAFRRPSGLSRGDEFSAAERLKKKPLFQTGASFDGSPGSGLTREPPGISQPLQEACWNPFECEENADFNVPLTVVSEL